MSASVARAGGQFAAQLQWADEGKPLYTFVQDKRSGDVTGDNMKGIWHVVPEAVD